MKMPPVPVSPRRGSPATGRSACLLFGAVWLFAGCASLNRAPSGYLADYPETDELAGKKHLLRKIATADDLAGIDSFHVEEVAWRSQRPPDWQTNPAKAAPLLQVLREALVNELSRIRPVVDNPGPNTARVRAAFTDVVKSKPAVNVVTSVLVGPVTNGGAVIEAEVRQADGTVVAQVVSGKAGNPLDLAGFFAAQGHARKASRLAARRLREALEKP
jgi:hypothetical protein